MKRSLLFASIVLFSFWGCQKETHLDSFDFIEDVAPFILEESIVNNDSIHQGFTSFPFIEKLKIEGGKKFVAFEAISPTEFEILSIITIDQSNYNQLLDKLKKSGLKAVSRNYSSYSISEISSNNRKFHFTHIANHFLYSTSALLIEKAIRNITHQKEEGKLSPYDVLKGFSMVKEDDGNIIIRNESIFQLIKLPIWVEKLNRLYQHDALSVLDFKKREASLNFNGFSIGGSNSRLHYFQSQQATPIQIARYIPSHVRLFFHFGVTDFSRFADSSSVDTVSQYSSILGDEIAIINNRLDEPDLIFEINEKLSEEKLIKVLDVNTSAVERFGEGEIRKLKGTHLFQSLFSKLGIEDATYYLTIKGNVVIFSKDVNHIKSYLESIDRDDTWGKSLEFQHFFEKGLQESNFSLFIKDTRVETKKSTRLASIIQELELQNLKWFSIQHSALDNHFYTNVNINTSEQKSSAQPLRKVNFEFDSPLISYHLVRSDNALELIVEDEKNRIHHFSNSQKIDWKFELGNSIISSIKPIDYFKNKKVQLQVATESSLYIIDRLGRRVSNYPMNLPEKFIYNEVIDYDKSGNYRFLFARENKIFLFDKSQKSLPGWNPKILSGDLMFSPNHYRIGGKDYFLAILKDGSVYLFNRRGEVVPGYPKLTDARISGDYSLQVGSSLQTSNLFLVNQEGVLYRINLGMEENTKMELVRSKNSVFALLNHSGGQSFSVARIDASFVAIFTQDGKSQFEISNPGSPTLLSQAFVRKDGTILFAFFDATQKLTYLFDQSGQPIAPSPLESSLPIKLASHLDSDILYIVNNKVLTKFPL